METSVIIIMNMGMFFILIELNLNLNITRDIITAKIATENPNDIEDNRFPENTSYDFTLSNLVMYGMDKFIDIVENIMDVEETLTPNRKIKDIYDASTPNRSVLSGVGKAKAYIKIHTRTNPKLQNMAVLFLKYDFTPIL